MCSMSRTGNKEKIKKNRGLTVRASRWWARGSQRCNLTTGHLNFIFTEEAQNEARQEPTYTAKRPVWPKECVAFPTRTVLFTKRKSGSLYMITKKQTGSALPNLHGAVAYCSAFTATHINNCLEKLGGNILVGSGDHFFNFDENGYILLIECQGQ